MDNKRVGAEGLTGESSKSRDNAVVAASSVNVCSQKRFATAAADIVLELLEEGRFLVTAARDGAILSGISNLGIKGSMCNLTPMGGKNKIIISFVDMNNPKAVQFSRVGVFWNHHVDNVFPSIKDVTVLDGVVEQTEVKV